MVIETKSANTAVIAASELESLQKHLTGQLITAASPEYDEARKVRNVTVNRRPLALVRAENAEDVAMAVRYATDHGRALAVRSGGHSVPRLSMIDDAVVADLSLMKRIIIDPDTRVATVQAGATSGDLAGPASSFGLALSTGDTSSVGFGGLTTGGGMGFMVRKHGLAIDNLLAARVVTADGSIVTASETDHPDLFWGIRGGGGNLGIVTQFKFQLASVPHIFGGELILPLTRDAVRGYLDYSVSAPDDLSTIANLMHAPPFPHVPQEWIGKPVLSILVCWTGDAEEGERAVAPLRALGKPVADELGLMPYPGIYDFTAHQAMPHAFFLRSMLSNEISDATVESSIAAVENASSPFSIVQFRGLGGAMARVGNEETAFAHRDKRFLAGVIGIWMDAAEDSDPHYAWTESLWQTIRHEGSGVYVNFLDDEGPDRVHDAYPPATYARLAAIKKQYDPQNLFRFNQNIQPGA